MEYVYILVCQHNIKKIYIGVTDNVERRLTEHNTGLSNYTSRFKPWELVTMVGFKYREQAEEFEKYLKNGSGFAFMKKHLLPR